MCECDGRIREPKARGRESDVAPSVPQHTQPHAVVDHRPFIEVHIPWFPVIFCCPEWNTSAKAGDCFDRCHCLNLSTKWDGESRGRHYFVCIQGPFLNTGNTRLLQQVLRAASGFSQMLSDHVLLLWVHRSDSVLHACQSGSICVERDTVFE